MKPKYTKTPHPMLATPTGAELGTLYNPAMPSWIPDVAMPEFLPMGVGHVKALLAISGVLSPEDGTIYRLASPADQPHYIIAACIYRDSGVVVKLEFPVTKEVAP